MGWLDVFCCVRKRDDAETEVLVAPARARGHGTSVTSQDGYGTMAMTRGTTGSSSQSHSSSQRPGPPRSLAVTESQRERMAEISRTAGSHMRPIGHYIAGRSVSPLPPSQPSSTPSSRTPSPSPPRPETSPPGGVISPAHSASSERRRSRHYSTGSSSATPRGERERAREPTSRVVSAPAATSTSDDVVHKSIFDGLAPTPARSQPSSRRSSGSSRKKKARRASQTARS